MWRPGGPPLFATDAWNDGQQPIRAPSYGGCERPSTPCRLRGTSSDAPCHTNGTEAIATITELRSKTSELVNRGRRISTGIMSQKNNEPCAVLVSYDRFLEIIQGEKKRR
jgi:hypothetical protein